MGIEETGSAQSGEALGREPERTPALSRQRDPRWIAVVLEELLRLGPVTEGDLAQALRRRAELEPQGGVHPAHGVDRRVEWRQVGHMRRELQGLGWIEFNERRWKLTVEGAKVAQACPTESPFGFARWLCLAGERAYGNVVSRLLDRLWELNPDQQGAVLLPTPSIAQEVPLVVAELEPWLRQMLQAQLERVMTYAPGLQLPELSTTLTSAKLPRSERWEGLPPRLRQLRMFQLIEEHTLGWLFEPIAAPAQIKVWQTRMDWAGFTLLTLHLHETRGRIWFPVGAFRERSDNTGFVPIVGIEHEGLTWHVHRPAGADYEENFVRVLFDTYALVQSKERTEYVSLAAVRDLVCYQLRIAHEHFQTLLQRIFPRVLRREFPYGLSLEVDITPRERSRLQASLPVTIDHIPRHIIAMQRLTAG